MKFIGQLTFGIAGLNCIRFESNKADRHKSCAHSTLTTLLSYLQTLKLAYSNTTYHSIA